MVEKKDLTDSELSSQEEKESPPSSSSCFVRCRAGSVFKVCYRNIYERQDFFFFFFLSLPAPLSSPASISPCNLRFVLWYTYTSRTGFSLSHYIREKRLFLLVFVFLFFLPQPKRYFPPENKTKQNKKPSRINCSSLDVRSSLVGGKS